MLQVITHSVTISILGTHTHNLRYTTMSACVCAMWRLVALPCAHDFVCAHPVRPPAPPTVSCPSAASRRLLKDVLNVEEALFVALFDSWSASRPSQTCTPPVGPTGAAVRPGLERSATLAESAQSGTDMDRIVGSALSVALESIAHVQFESTESIALACQSRRTFSRPVNKIGTRVNPDSPPDARRTWPSPPRGIRCHFRRRAHAPLEFGSALQRSCVHGADMVIPHPIWLRAVIAPRSLAVVLPVDLLHDGADAIGLDDTRGHERIDRRRPAGGTALAEHSAFAVLMTIDRCATVCTVMTR